MTVLTLDDIAYEDVLRNGLGKYIRKSFLNRTAFEVATRLEALPSDEEREAFMREMKIYPFMLQGRVEESLGLHVQFEKLDNLYVPAGWARDYREREVSGDSPGWGHFMEGMLSWDDANGLPEEQKFSIFEHTLFRVRGDSQVYFLAYYSQWRQAVIEYTRWRLGNLLERIKQDEEKFTSETIRPYYDLILPLVERYRNEVQPHLL